MTKEEQVIETIGKGPEMSPNEYQRLALRTASDESMKDPLLNGLLGLGGETGECQDLYKKHRFQGHELDKAKMAKELGRRVLVFGAHGLCHRLQPGGYFQDEHREAPGQVSGWLQC